MSYSPDQLRAADEFSRLVEQLENAVAELKQLLDGAKPLLAQVFDLPRVTREEEEEPVQFIAPETISGDAAFARGLQALDDWYGVPGYSTKAVHRTPGVMAFHTADPESVMAAVERCNTTKRALKVLTPRLGSQDDRFELIHSRHYMLILLQLTRQITALTCPPAIRSVTFTWGFKTEIFKLTVDKACKLVEGLRHRPVPLGDNQTPWPERVDREIARLRSLPTDTELRHRRLLKVRPMTNVRYILTEEEKLAREAALARGERVNQPVKLYEGHTPLLILNPPRGMTVGELRSFNADVRSKRAPRRGLKTSSEPVTAIAPIYLVQDRR
jgi:DNA replication terminus site-binding protein